MATGCERFDIDISRPFERPGSDIKKEGCLKKLKTMKSKYFILRSTSSSGPARLEYYDSEKKYRRGLPPKRSIHLHECFNINKKSDSKHKFAIALYTKDDCFSIIADNEIERDDWLRVLLNYQDEYLRDGEIRREHFDHVWQVHIQPKGLGLTKGIKGSYRMCLSSHTISLVKINADKPQFSFQLATVRSVAHSDCVFKLEVGSWAPTGAGDIWMQVDDSVIAQSMHEAILQCMKDPLCDGVDEIDSKRFDKRAESCSMVRNPGRDFRPRTVSDSRPHSPLRVRKPDPQRPMSTVYTLRSTSLPVDSISPGTSPHGHILLEQSLLANAYRNRSDSMESKGSRASYTISQEDPGFLDGHTFVTPEPQVIDEEEDFQDYSVMTPEAASIPSSPGDHSESHLSDSGQPNSYVDMRPISTTPPVIGGGYVDMTLGQQKCDSVGSHDLSPSSVPEGDHYMMMGPGRPASSPIPIHPSKDMGGPGYMDMSHSSHGSHLPTVQEGGSNEGYLPMTPTYGQSPRTSSANLRPERAVCMVSDDTGEFHQRTLSLGSRPFPKTSSRLHGFHETNIRKGVSDNGRSCSAPHLIPTKARTLNVDSPTPSVSPLSMSLKSDDSDSFMELEFYRPRTASDSYSYRPRASSFGTKTANQGHRPRSSSHGQSMRPFKLKLNALKASSQEYIGKNSRDSLGRISRDSLRMSSNESLRRQGDDGRYRSPLLVTDYIDMSYDKSKTPSPQPPLHGSSGAVDRSGYVDMTVGSSRSNSPHRGKSLHCSSSEGTSKLHSFEALDQQPSSHHGEGYVNVDLPQPVVRSGSGSGAALSTSAVYMNYKTGDHSGQSSTKPSGKHSRSSSAENVDSYVMYEPSVLKSMSQMPGGQCSSGHLLSQPHVSGDGMRLSPQNVTTSMLEHREGSNASIISSSSSGSSRDSSKQRSERNAARILHQNVGGSGNSTKDKKKTVSSKSPPAQESDEYIEFSPMTTKSSSRSEIIHTGGHGNGPSGAKIDQEKLSDGDSESQYMNFEPGQISSTATAFTTSSSASMTPREASNMTDQPKSAHHTSLGTERSTGKGNRPGSGKKSSKKSSPRGRTSSKSSAGTENDYLNLDFSQKESDKGITEEQAKSPESTVKTSHKAASLFSKPFSQQELSSPLESMLNRGASGAAQSKTASTKTDSLPKTKVDVMTKPKTESQSKSKVEMKQPSPAFVSEAESPKMTQTSPRSNQDSQRALTKKISTGSRVTASSVSQTSDSKESKESAGLARPDSTPCMLTLDSSPGTKPGTGPAVLVVENNPRSRHSLTDLSGYEQMTFPSNTLSSSQQQTQQPSGSQKMLNYADLDLGSAENVGEGDAGSRTPRNKSRHPSTAEERIDAPSYAQIDFEKSETLKNSGNTDVKFTL